jgi:hypothetical protein
VTAARRGPIRRPLHLRRSQLGQIFDKALGHDFSNWRRSLARLLLRGRFWRLGELVRPEASIVILRDGAMMAHKIQGKLNVCERR